MCLPQASPPLQDYRVPADEVADRAAFMSCWTLSTAASSSGPFASSRAICADPSFYSDLSCRKGMLSRSMDFSTVGFSRLSSRSFGRKAPNCEPTHRPYSPGSCFVFVFLFVLYTPMLSFVLLQLEPLFRYNSREWSGESKR
ncbi:BQ5605_C009g05428 [Microbotryum silenes-dioicae]|uniref:BQ5605_C009g05421 protein n=1 Tax=Microbotryum silenes-dioicae TaxID=796604 RepID=A0A2X0MH53_9BASI|nr:BQ5605_C009g05421 [Microbotryum silenes-dioicae]SGY80980.1 BQ5605_C009g05428 [Microbotryum silenes-dioicae]